MVLIRLMKIVGVLLIMTVGCSLYGWAETAYVKQNIEKPVQQAIDVQQETQRIQVQWRDEREQQVTVYEALQQEQERLKTENQRLGQSNAILNERIALKTKQLFDIDQISSQIQPYLITVLNQLKQLFDNDSPFLKQERLRRINGLEQIMQDPDVAVNEKFRKTMEALLVEAEYSRTIEVYQETIDLAGEMKLVNIFRLGRVSLFYQTLDKKQCGVYNTAAAAWTPLPNAYNRDIQIAMDIGAKRRPVELLHLPIGRMAVK